MFFIVRVSRAVNVGVVTLWRIVLDVEVAIVMRARALPGVVDTVKTPPRCPRSLPQITVSAAVSVVLPWST